MKKKILFIAAAVLGIAAGCQKYELNTDFSMPVELDSPCLLYTSDAADE